MAITAAMVKELREATAAGMMDAKKALVETNGDFDAAVDWLRTKGLAKAAKKSGRVAAEGLVAVAVNGGVGVAVEVNSETDFVAKNADFQKMVGAIAGAATGVADIEALAAADLGGKTVADTLTDKIATIGENMNIRRFQRMADGDAYGTYLHMGGKIGVVVSLGVSNQADSETVKMLARDLAMHVASEAPLAIDKDGVDQSVIENEKDIFIAQAKEQGKPDNIIEKMVTGKINKFLAESCLLDQAFVKDPDMKVKKLIEKTGKELDADISVKSFARFKVGEGIAKKDENFADEVAKMTGS